MTCSSPLFWVWAFVYGRLNDPDTTGATAWLSGGRFSNGSKKPCFHALEPGINCCTLRGRRVHLLLHAADPVFPIAHKQDLTRRKTCVPSINRSRGPMHLKLLIAWRVLDQAADEGDTENVREAFLWVIKAEPPGGRVQSAHCKQSRSGSTATQV